MGLLSRYVAHWPILANNQYLQQSFPPVLAPILWPSLISKELFSQHPVPAQSRSDTQSHFSCAFLPSSWPLSHVLSYAFPLHYQVHYCTSPVLSCALQCSISPLPKCTIHLLIIAMKVMAPCTDMTGILKHIYQTVVSLQYGCLKDNPSMHHIWMIILITMLFCITIHCMIILGFDWWFTKFKARKKA